VLSGCAAGALDPARAYLRDRASDAYFAVGLSDSACFRCRASGAYLAVGLSELSRSMPTRGRTLES